MRSLLYVGLIPLHLLALENPYPCHAAVNFWLSEVGDPLIGSVPPLTLEQTPALALAPGGMGKLYLWARPEPGQTLSAWALNVVAENVVADTPAAVELTGSEVSDYDVLQPIGPAEVAKRWEFVSEPTAPDGAAILPKVAGFTLQFPGGERGVGIGPLGGGGSSYSDPFYTPATDSWLLGHIDLKAESSGTSNVYLQVDNLGVFQGTPSSLTHTSVILGVVTDGELSSRNDAQVNKNSATPEASITVVAPTADFDGDDDVDGADLLAWQRGLGTSQNAMRAQGDADASGAVDAADLTIWKQQFSAQLSNQLASIPEPATRTWAIACLVIGAAVHRLIKVEKMRRVIVAAILAGVITVSASPEAQAVTIVNDNFDSYATQPAFESVWTPIGTNVDNPTALLSTDQAVTAPKSVHIPDVANTEGNGRYRNQRSFTETSTYSTSGNLGIGDKLVWSFDFHDWLTTPGLTASQQQPQRHYANLQDGTGVGLATNQLVAMGLNNNQSSAHSGGNYFMARILGYNVTTAPDLDGGPVESGTLGSGAFFKLNDFGVGERSGGWSNLKVEISTDDGQSVDYAFFVNNVLAERVSNIGTAASVRSYDHILIGSGLTNNGVDAYFDNMRLEYIPRAADVVVWTNPAGGDFLTASNWQNGLLPGGVSEVIFDLPNTYSVSFAGNVVSRGLTVQQGEVTLALNSSTYTVGHINVTSQSLAVTGGTLSQANVQNSEGILVAFGGHLSVSGGGQLNSGGSDVTIGGPDGTSGSASVGSLGNVASNWTNIRNLTLGGGMSSLGVTHQGSVSVSNTLHIQSGSNVTVASSDAPFGAVNVGGGLATAGEVRIGANGTLLGGGLINGKLNNVGGWVRPGNSPGILTVNGDFTQSANGTLQIEVGGLTPGTQHDQVVVVPPGKATIDGRLDVPFINGFVPVAGQEITFLTAVEISGPEPGSEAKFKSITAPSLDPDVAMTVEMETLPGGGQEMKLKFLTPLRDIQFDETAPATANWTELETWENTAGDDRLPDERDVIRVSTTGGGAQTVQVTTGNPKTHSLEIVGEAGALTIEVGNTQTLSAVVGATVGDQATVEVEGGAFESANIAVAPGGAIQVNNLGTVLSTDDIEVESGAIQVNAGGKVVSSNSVDVHGQDAMLELNTADQVAVAASTLTVDEGAVLSGVGRIAANVTLGANPGAAMTQFKPGGAATGAVVIEGDLHQGEHSQLVVDVTASDHDVIELTGKAELGGTVMFNLAPDVTISPTNPEIVIPLIQAGELADGTQFDAIVDNHPDIVFSIIYSDEAVPPVLANGESASTAGDGATAIGAYLGDMNRDGVTNAQDAAAFATALVNPLAYVAQYRDIGNIRGNCNEDDFFDFQDIVEFRRRSGVSMSVLTRLIQAAAVPEPSGAWLAIIAFLGLGLRNKRS